LTTFGKSDKIFSIKCSEEEKVSER